MSIYDLLPENKKEQPQMIGVAVAKVTNNKDPDKLGRVKCKFIAKNSEDETDWIRIASFMGGKERGAFFLPEVEDEVLIAFAGGDISKPYVIGSLWNKKDKPPETNKDGKNAIKKIKTKGGSEIIFNDTDKKEKITLSTPSERKIDLDDGNKSTKITDKGDKNIIKIDSNAGMISIEGQKKLSFKAGGCKIIMDGTANSITIESSTTLKLKAQQINIEAGGSLAIKSNGMLDIKSSAVCNLKGSIVKIN
ncbi:MAG: phage baseplate assembly protein V [Marinisporobacter sp.]|jgi:uncharacterized protein involved in type VI secretion and phage assembly|nr:phage baseplate assembly protein V [Marinisporobacter sp.]